MKKIFETIKNFFTKLVSKSTDIVEKVITPAIKYLNEFKLAVEQKDVVKLNKLISGEFDDKLVKGFCAVVYKIFDLEAQGILKTDYNAIVKEAFNIFSKINRDSWGGYLRMIIVDFIINLGKNKITSSEAVVGAEVKYQELYGTPII